MSKYEISQVHYYDSLLDYVTHTRFFRGSYHIIKYEEFATLNMYDYINLAIHRYCNDIIEENTLEPHTVNTIVCRLSFPYETINTIKGIIIGTLQREPKEDSSFSYLLMFNIDGNIYFGMIHEPAKNKDNKPFIANITSYNYIINYHNQSTVKYDLIFKEMLKETENEIKESDLIDIFEQIKAFRIGMLLD